MYKIACSKKELSCIISSIFQELLPICEECSSSEDVELIIKGRLVETGTVATLKVTDYGCDFNGDIKLINKVRKERCLYAAIDLTKES